MRENYHKIPLDFKEISISALMFLPCGNPQKNMMAARKCPEFEGKVSGLRRAERQFLRQSVLSRKYWVIPSSFQNASKINLFKHRIELLSQDGCRNLIEKVAINQSF